MDEISKELELLQKERLANSISTEMAKKKFISEIKSGLGERIKQNPNKPIILKKSKLERFKIFLKKLINRI